jgi:hypothetical protein
LVERVLDFITIGDLIWLEILVPIVWLGIDSFQGNVIPEDGFLFPLLRRFDGFKLLIVLLIIVFLIITFWIFELV